jgi:DNA-directed RNA polymerase alpha subunit
LVNTQQNDLIIKEKIIMTQRNIDAMDIIVNKMAEGFSISQALQLVYNKRNVGIPYKEENFRVSLMDLGMTSRSTNALLRAKMRTLGDVVEFCQKHKITDVANFGQTCGIEVFETILDYCWDHMTEKEKVDFLIDTVERNIDNIRAEIDI